MHVYFRQTNIVYDGIDIARAHKETTILRKRF